ncbi:MAG: DNA cytosine methyltransferase [Desulfurococcaceae archaeon]
MKRSLNAVDLFCGAGGLTLGFKRAGYRVLLGLDVDWDAIRTYVLNNPEVAWINKDIRKVTAEEILDAVGSRDNVDVAMAGIPCEGYSLLNRRYDPSDPRNYLFVEFMRIVKILKPKAVLIENVPGLIRRESGRFRVAIEKALEGLGYTTRSFTINALNYGVPQRRVRLFFVGIQSGGRFEPPEPTHGSPSLLSFASSAELKPYVTVWDAISDLPPLRPGEEKTRYESEPKTEYQRIMRGECTRLYNHRAPNHPEWTVKLIESTEPGRPLYGTFKQRIRLSWDEPAPTIPAGGVRPQWFFAHPEQPRGITVREAARLQSFPDSYVFVGSLIKQRVLVGDAVPPLLAEALARKLAECI